MKTTIIVALLVSSALSYIYAAPVIINDTGDWAGEIQAKEEGFLFYNEGVWTQYGANFHSGKRITSFLVNFSPIITNEGTNYVTCTYDQVGWIWSYGGPRLEETISFETRNLIIEEPSTELRAPNKEVGVSVHPYANVTAEKFPSNGIINYPKKIKVQSAFWADVSGSPIVNWVSYGGGGLAFLKGALATKFALAVGTAAVVGTAFSHIINLSTVDEIDFSDVNYAPASDQIPTQTDTWSFSIRTLGDGYVINTLIYDGGGKGFAPHGETKYIQETFFKNLRRVPTYNLHSRRNI